MSTLNEQMLDTDIGRRYLDERFTLLALLIGDPEPLESLRVLKFIEAFEQAFGIQLVYSRFWTRDNDATDWIGRYAKWYQENRHEQEDNRR